MVFVESPVVESVKMEHVFSLRKYACIYPNIYASLYSKYQNR